MRFTNKTTLIPIIALAILINACSGGYKFILREQAEKDFLDIQTEPVGNETRLQKLPPNIRAIEKTVLYSSESERVEVIGKTSGLAENIKRVYITLFTDMSQQTNLVDVLPEGATLESEFDRLFRAELENNGFDIIDRMKYAQAIISGSIPTFDITDAQNETNTDGLIYFLRIEYSVEDIENGITEDSRIIEEKYLVVNTDSFDTNTVVPLILEKAVQHIAEAVIYGWAIDESKNKKYEILGGYDETDNLTNR